MRANNTQSKTKQFEIGVLVLIVAAYIFHMVTNFWVTPGPSDALRYLGPVLDNNWGYFYYLDGISVALGLRIFIVLLPVSGYLAGMAFIGFINVALMSLAIVVAFRYSGYLAALLVGLTLGTSFIFLEEATRVTRDQSEALLALISFLLMMMALKASPRRGNKLIAISGIFSALALLTKLSALSTIGIIGLFLIVSRNWTFILRYILGGIAGGIFALIAYVLFFDLASLVETIRWFFGTELNIYFVAVQSNRLEQYLDLVVSLEMFPLIALLITPGAYRIKASRNFYFLAWSSIIFLIAMIAVTPRGLAPDERYMFLAYSSVAIGMGIYLETIFRDSRAALLDKLKINGAKLKIGIGLIAILLLFWALRNAIQFDPRQFTPISVPLHIKLIYVLGPLIVLLSMGAFTVYKQKEFFLVFLLALPVWAGTYNGGRAYSDVKILRNINSFYYESAQLLNEVPGEEITIYVNAFNEFRNADKFRRVYGILFNEKFDYGDQLHHPEESRQLVLSKLPYFKSIDELELPIAGYLLTDDEDVFEFFSGAEVYDTLDWRGTTLYIVDMSSTGN